MELEQAREIAQRVKATLAPYCQRIEIAGSIRRGVAQVGDIEIVAIPDQYEAGLFGDGDMERCPDFVRLVEQWPKVRGDAATGRYTQRMLPEGIKLDLFTAMPNNWGLIYAIRTGSAAYSHEVLACGWVRAGYKSMCGMLTYNGVLVPVREEHDLFKLIGRSWVEPEKRQCL